jgi:hypothetical protein
MLAPVNHILPLTSVRRERLLPLAGRVTVREGQKVNPVDVVAEAHFGQEHLLIDVARMLELKPAAAQKTIQVKAGDQLSKGEPVARLAGLIPQLIRTPVDGRVLVVGNGQILLETGDTSMELQAGLPGVVTRLISDRGVEITFSGALIQGVWGNGQVNVGMLLPVLSTPEEELTAGQLDVSQRGSVLLGGYCGDAAALHAAADLPVRGLILGSMSPALIPQAMQARYPIILVDGFAKRPLNSAAYKLLTTNAKRETTLNAVPLDRQTGVHPEILIPLPVNQEPAAPPELENFAPEQPVRLTRDPHCSEVGQIIRLLPGLSTMPSGLRVQACEVKLESGEQVIVPLANLEVLA